MDGRTNADNRSHIYIYRFLFIAHLKYPYKLLQNQREKDSIFKTIYVIIFMLYCVLLGIFRGLLAFSQTGWLFVQAKAICASRTSIDPNYPQGSRRKSSYQKCQDKKICKKENCYLLILVRFNIFCFFGFNLSIKFTTLLFFRCAIYTSFVSIKS